MQGTAIIIANMIGGITPSSGGTPPVVTYFILGDGTFLGDDIIAEDGRLLVSELAP
jgi:hypothetical protein